MSVVFLSPLPQRSEHFGSVQLKFYYFQTALPQKTCSEFCSRLPNLDVPQDTCRLKTLQTTSFPKPAVLPMEISSHHLITNILKARAPSSHSLLWPRVSISGRPARHAREAPPPVSQADLCNIWALVLHQDPLSSLCLSHATPIASSSGYLFLHTNQFQIEWH